MSDLKTIFLELKRIEIAINNMSAGGGSCDTTAIEADLTTLLASLSNLEDINTLIETNTTGIESNTSTSMGLLDDVVAAVESINTNTTGLITAITNLQQQVYSKKGFTTFKIGWFQVTGTLGSINADEYVIVYGIKTGLSETPAQDATTLAFVYSITSKQFTTNTMTLVMSRVKILDHEYIRAAKSRASKRLTTTASKLNTCQVAETVTTVVDLLTENNATGAMIVVYNGSEVVRWTIDGSTPNTTTGLGFKTVGDATIIILGDHPDRPGGDVAELSNFQIVATGTCYIEVSLVHRIKSIG